MIAGGLSDIGLIREDNQDSYFVSKDYKFPLFIIADGMGGHNAGEIASNMALSTIKNIFLINRDNLNSESQIVSMIRDAIEKANNNIFRKSLELPKYNGMGTTVTLVYLFEGKAYIGHIGDSRAYYITDQEIKQITEDHSLVNELVKNGNITIEEANIHPQRNLITRAVGTSKKICVDIHSIDTKKDEYIVLSSDGLTNLVKDDRIFETVNSNYGIKEKCEHLVDYAKEKGGTDNISVIIIKF